MDGNRCREMERSAAASDAFIATTQNCQGFPHVGLAPSEKNRAGKREKENVCGCVLGCLRLWKAGWGGGCGKAPAACVRRISRHALARGCAQMQGRLAISLTSGARRSVGGRWKRGRVWHITVRAEHRIRPHHGTECRCGCYRNSGLLHCCASWGLLQGELPEWRDGRAVSAALAPAASPGSVARP